MEKEKTTDKPVRYIDTYFRIEAGYVWGEGMDEKACRRFYDEIILLFVRSGWTVVPHSIGNTVDVVNGKSSNESPLAAELIGKRAGETISLPTPRGPQKLEILSIAYGAVGTEEKR